METITTPNGTTYNIVNGRAVKYKNMPKQDTILDVDKIILMIWHNDFDGTNGMIFESTLARQLIKELIKQEKEKMARDMIGEKYNIEETDYDAGGTDLNEVFNDGHNQKRQELIDYCNKQGLNI